MIRFLSYSPYPPSYSPIPHFPKMFFLFLMCILHCVAFMLWLWLSLLPAMALSSFSFTASPQLFLSLFCMDFISIYPDLSYHLSCHTVREYVLSLFQPVSYLTLERSSFSSLPYLSGPFFPHDCLHYNGIFKTHGLWSLTAWFQILALIIYYPYNLRKILNLSEPLFPHAKYGDNNTPSVITVVSEKACRVLRIISQMC